MRKLIVLLACFCLISAPLISAERVALNTKGKVVMATLFATVGAVGVTLGTVYTVGTGAYFILKAGKITFEAGKESNK